MSVHDDPGAPAPDPHDDTPTDGPPTQPAAGDEGLLLATTRRAERWAVAPANLVCAVALAVNHPGPSPALLFLQGVVPLPVWAVLFAAATVLLAARRSEPGHVLGFAGWAMISMGAVIGVATGSTASPSASVIFAGTTLTLAAIHLAGVLYHRAARTHRAQAG